MDFSQSKINPLFMSHNYLLVVCGVGFPTVEFLFFSFRVLTSQYGVFTWNVYPRSRFLFWCEMYKYWYIADSEICPNIATDEFQGTH